MSRKYDFDYNFDPEGTSISTSDIDPYADDVNENIAKSAELNSRKPAQSPLKSPNHQWKDEYRDNRDSYSPSQRNRIRFKSPNTPAPAKDPELDYLAQTVEESSTLTKPASQRKLLILDLNGTLLYRSPHQHRNPYPNEPGQPLRPLRIVHSRPYLQSFKEYLFHPRVRCWLDTMVWSSAQPHSVADMTQRCFGEYANVETSGKTSPGLVAVWARDTMGLTRENYYRKSQTTKDLSKPWAELSDLGHSQHTTLLVDDSPLKAHLQPWSHLCVPEYTAEMRRSDVMVREAEVAKQRRQAVPTPSGGSNHIGDVNDGREIQDEDVDESKKRRRKQKKERKKVERAENVDQEGDGCSTSADGRPMDFDQTLLAVIGVLDAIKNQDRVSGWMRYGGLLNIPPSSGSSSSSSSPQRSQSTTPTPPKKRRVSNECLEPGADEASSSFSPTSSPRPLLPSSPHVSAPELPSSPIEEQASTGIPMTETILRTSGLWFEHPEAFQYWVERGIRALEKLGIEVKSGIVGSTG